MGLTMLRVSFRQLSPTYKEGVRLLKDRGYNLLLGVRHDGVQLMQHDLSYCVGGKLVPGESALRTCQLGCGSQLAYPGS